MKLKTLDNYSTKSTIIQIVLVVLANLGMFLCGLSLGFPSVILGPLVESTGPGFHASVVEGSWIASMAHITAPFGCFLGGPIVERLGRRRGMQLLNSVNFVGWLLIALVPFPLRSLTPLLVGRFLTGFCVGLAYPACTSYTAEVVTLRLRTALVTLSSVMMGVGIFAAYLLAYLFQDQWTYAAVTGTVVSAGSMIYSIFLPESPMWLITKNRLKEAKESLMTLRGVTSYQEVEEDFLEMTKNTLPQNMNKASWSDIVKDIRKPEAYKPLFIMTMYFFFQQTSGITVIIVFGVEFARAAEIQKDSYTVGLFIGVVRVVSSFFATWFCNSYGRRIPAITMAIGMTISLLGLVAYVGLRHSYPETVPPCTWIPATFILLNIFTSSIGFSSLPVSMLGEIFPTKVRGVCSGISSGIAYTLSFIGIKFYLIIEPMVGNMAVFIFFATFALNATIFLAIFLPETHGKTLEEIENHFKGAKNSEKKVTNNA